MKYLLIQESIFVFEIGKILQVAYLVGNQSKYSGSPVSVSKFKQELLKQGEHYVGNLSVLGRQLETGKNDIFKTLKGQVTFLKLCLLVVGLALIIPRLTLFFMNIRFQAKKKGLYVFFASVDASTLEQYIFHAYLFVNPKRELEFKIVVIVGLQDKSSMYITLETLYVFILYVYYLRIKLTGICQRRPL